MVGTSGIILGNLAASVIATFIPIFIGLFIPSIIAGSRVERLAILMAESSGIMFWSFLDTMNDAVLLGVNQGFSGSLEQAALVLLFAAGLLLLFGLERTRSRTVPPGENDLMEVSYMVAVLVAVGIGFHALAEGIEIGSLIPTAANLITAIGGINPVVAYTLHKFLEGFVVGAFAISAKANRYRSFTLGVVLGLPTVIGTSLALVGPISSTYFFALGGAGAVYAEYKLIPRAAMRGNIVLCAVASLLGFYAMYLAGLFHG